MPIVICDDKFSCNDADQLMLSKIEYQL